MREPPAAASRFETARLVLRRPRAGDAADLIALDGEPDVRDYLTARGADLSDMAGRIAARIAASEEDPADPYGWWVIAGREDGAFHGRGILAPMWEGADVELGLYLRRGSRRKGIATEAATALLDHAFFALALPRVVGVLLRRDSPGKALLARLRLSHHGKIILHGVEADRYVVTSHGWLPRRR